MHYINDFPCISIFCTTDEGSCIAAESFGFIFLLIGKENYNVKLYISGFILCCYACTQDTLSASPKKLFFLPKCKNVALSNYSSVYMVM